LVNEGYDPKYGARPLKRTIQRRVLDPLSLDILNGRIRDGDHVVADVENGKLVFLRDEMGQPK
jgi:ATP-dependent Clp protease ATP-binding subunit ClpB